MSSTVEEGMPPPAAELLAELGTMKFRALQKRAEELGVGEDKLDDAEEKTEVIELIIQKIAEIAAREEAERIAALKEELGAMKFRALQKRAEELGVDEEKLDDAEEKPEVIALILAVLASTDGWAVKAAAEAEAAAAAVAEAEAARLAQLRDELSGMKMRALQKRATELGVDDEALDEAEDKTAVIELILEQEGGKSAAAAPASSETSSHSKSVPHQGVPAKMSGSSTGKDQKLSDLFGKKHVILSYQWDAQDEVKAIGGLLKARGIPTWMDIDGGMKADIYDSMAEGVGNAAVAVPFMTQAYEQSENCALELKFAKQTGIPIVPVMMTLDYTATGWLGLLTAGSLWTPMHDKATLEQSVDGLIRQIKIAVSPDSEEIVESTEHEEAPDFSAKDLRDELDRLKSEQQPAVSNMTALKAAGQPAKVPAVVPWLPDGCLISKSMEELLDRLTTGTISARVGFFGMGGIGKTVISTWLVRHDNVRQHFDEIVWITMGQTPAAVNVQSSAFQQLTGGSFTDESVEHCIQALQQAMSGRKILLVLDDLWEQEHEKLLNHIDETAGSKVLISSRVRQVLERGDSTSIVDIELPSEDDAVRMLLSTAGLPVDGEAPAQAGELVQFCKLLPLTISIAGKLVKDFGIGIAADEWTGITDLMKEEFAESNGQRSVEESVIAASLNSIRGAQKENVLHLFKSLALLPEDTVVPLEIVSMMCGSVAKADSSSMKRPNVLNTRRWLKQLIDRSLVLGTVDRPALHDICLDYVLAQHTEDELRQSHRRLVDLLRAARPIDAVTKAPEWNNVGDTPLSHYVRYQCAGHIRHGWNADWESDTYAASNWLGDYPQDDIVSAAASVLGSEKLEQLASQAEGSDDKWIFAKLAVATARQAGKSGEATLSWGRKALNALGELGAGEATGRRDDEERLELQTASIVMGIQNPADFVYLARIDYLVETPAAEKVPMDKAFGRYWAISPMVFTGNVGEDGGLMADVFVTFMKAMAGPARTHPDKDMRDLMGLLSMSANGYGSAVPHPEWDWEELFGPNGEMLIEATQAYNYDVHHTKLASSAFGADWPLVSGNVIQWLAMHFGNLVAANRWMDTCVDIFVNRFMENASWKQEMFGVWSQLIFGPACAVMLGREKTQQPIFAKLGLTWSTVDNFVDETVIPNLQFVRPRGDTTMGAHIVSAEGVSMHVKLHYIMISDDHGVSAAELAEMLPSLEDVIQKFNAGLAHSYMSIFNWDCSGFLLVGQACEKLGLYEQALPYAEMAATCRDITKGGCHVPATHCLGYRTKGRCLAALGKMAEAEEAFESSLASVAGLGLFLNEVLTLTDLKVLVLAKDGRAVEGSSRLKDAIHTLMGKSAAEDQLAALQVALGSDISVSEVLA